MSHKKPSMIQSERGSVFSVFSEEEIKEITLGKGRKVAVSGKIHNPGIIDVPEGATLEDIINLCGGIINKSSFKAAQLGIPFGKFLTKESLDKELDFNLFDEKTTRTIIILSQEDCIIQYARYYIDFLLGKMRDGSLEQYQAVESQIKTMWKILDRMSKGRSNMRDIYIKNTCSICKRNIKSKIQYNGRNYRQVL